ncbi:MAG TPA: IGHMBP2 family helicase [Aquificaceae bacterium]|nr:IGHMBP2 family helicase [Aquificaceae bacterium]
MKYLNEFQRKAVERALSSDKVFLIHGPPGTGKTTTLIECINQLVERGNRVLATADSNIAVDNIVERLIAKGVKVVRVGNPARILKSIQKHTLDYLIELEPEFVKAKKFYKEIEKLREEQKKYVKPEPRYRRGLSDEEILKRAKTGTPVRGLNPKVIRSMSKWIKIQQRIKEIYEKAKLEEHKAIKKILSKAEVICTTNSTAGSEFLQDFNFDVVIIDEATQSIEPSCLIPLVKGKKLIMAGDHKQLPPTVLSYEAREQLSYTLFERLLDIYGEEIYEVLRIQYRMNRKIMEFSNRMFYDGKLIAHESVANHTIEDFVEKDKLKNVLSPYREVMLPQNVIVFIDVEGAEEQRRGSTSYYNEKEASICKEIVDSLMGIGLKAKDIGVISPYEDQVDLLEELFENSEVEVKTVDGFQGREKEVIIISLVRANKEGDIGFLKDYRRLNVALTRARRKLIILGNGKTLSRDKVYRELIEYIKNEGLYINM